MSFEQHIKNVSPRLTQLKTNTPVMKVGDYYVVGGIGGDKIPGYPIVTQPIPTITISGTIVNANYIPLQGNVSDVTIKNATVNLTSVESNLVSSNIASGVTMFGITGTHEGGQVIDAGYITKTQMGVVFYNVNTNTYQDINQIYYLNINNVDEPVYNGTKSQSSNIIFTPNLVTYIDFSENQPFNDSKNFVTFTTQGTISKSNKWAILNENGYLQGDKVILPGNTTKTFVCVVDLSSQSQIFEEGSQDSGCLFSLVYGRSTGYLGWHGWAQDYSEWQSCSNGKHVIIVQYDAANEQLAIYIDGVKSNNVLSVTNNTGQDNNIRLGCYSADDWYSSGNIGYRLFAVYNKILTSEQKLKFNKYLND